MSVLERGALEESPLADLHAIASELSIDSYRRLRKEQLIDAILARQGDGPSERVAEAPDGPEEEESKGRRRRARRGGRSRPAREESETADAAEPQAPEPEEEAEDVIAEGVVEVLPNGSAFLRVSPPESSEDDVYISAAQVKRCELISGDTISGPRRPPRRSERFASLHRIDNVNGRPAGEIADGARFDELPAAFPREQLRLSSGDDGLEPLDRLTPIGRGSRVTIVGGPGSGKTGLLRRLAAALSAEESIQLTVILTGVRPEEIGEWDSPAPAQAASLASSAENQAQSVSSAVDQARRVAARGGDAVLLVDTLVGLPSHAARRALASARKLAEGGSLTVIATASEPLGGETTVIALDRTLALAGTFPALDLRASAVWRPELLLGEQGAADIAQARAELG